MKRMNRWLVWLAGLVAIVLAACTSTGGEPQVEPGATPTPETAVTEEATTAPGQDPLAGSIWTLASYSDSSGAVMNPLSDNQVTAEFRDGGINGNASCNRYFGPYTLDGSGLAFGPLGQTEMYCTPEELMAQERAYLAALSNVSAYRLENDQLVLLDEKGSTLITYTAGESDREPQIELTGTTWLLTTYNVGGDALTSALSGTRLTAVFSADGSVTGTSGCNSFGGPYSSEGNELSIGLLASTLMLCTDEAVMGQEAAYLTALQAAATYQIIGDTLELYAVDGILSAAFIAEPLQTLAGTAWQVISYNNGNEAVTSTIAGVELTAVFDEDGALTGMAGCNSYSATYRAGEDSITVSPPVSTRIFCESPEGIMEQETQYLTALETAVTYRIDGDVLEMRDAGGAVAATFRAVE